GAEGEARQAAGAFPPAGGLGVAPQLGRLAGRTFPPAGSLGGAYSRILLLCTCSVTYHHPFRSLLPVKAERARLAVVLTECQRDHNCRQTGRPAAQQELHPCPRTSTPVRPASTSGSSSSPSRTTPSRTARAASRALRSGRSRAALGSSS